MRDDLDRLVDMIEDEDRVTEHEDGFRDLKGSSQLSLCFRLEVLDAVIGDESDRTT